VSVASANASRAAQRARDDEHAHAADYRAAAIRAACRREPGEPGARYVLPPCELLPPAATLARHAAAGRLWRAEQAAADAAGRPSCVERIRRTLERIAPQ
jgi:hypothetical protein